jgi:carbon-monoxide dehydrogenase large subunit
VNDALHQLGVEICEIPITPRRILAALANAKRADTPSREKSFAPAVASP